MGPTTIFLWLGNWSNLTLLTIGLSGMHFGGVSHPIMLHYQNCKNCECYAITVYTDKLLNYLYGEYEPLTYLADKERRQVGSVWETDSCGDSSGLQKCHSLRCYDWLTHWEKRHICRMKCFQYDEQLELHPEFKWTVSKQHVNDRKPS